MGVPGNPPLVLLHALGESGGDWAPVDAKLAAYFRVHAPDLRGHGDSDWPGNYSLGLMARDVTSWLDRLGLDKVVLVGHSMGAGVAYLIAMDEPGRVGQLVIEDAAPLYRRDRQVPERPEGFAGGFDWAVVPAIVNQVNAGDPAMWEGLAAITAPTLIIGGARSYISQARLAEAAALIPRCDLVTIDAGHNVHREQPAEFARTVLGWLGAARPVAARPEPDGLPIRTMTDRTSLHANVAHDR
jgi:pimeloyl-ACP methyl ester carboxylesterase